MNTSAHRLGIEEVLNLPPLAAFRLLVSPPALPLAAAAELLAPVEEVDLSAAALPPTSPAERPTDTI
jgi:hypothetical protein